MLRLFHYIASLKIPKNLLKTIILVAYNMLHIDR